MHNHNMIIPDVICRTNIAERKRQLFNIQPSLEEQMLKEQFIESFTNLFKTIDESTDFLYDETLYEEDDKYITSEVYEAINDCFTKYPDQLSEAIGEVVKNAKYKYKKKEKAVDRAVADKINAMHDDIKNDIRDKYVERVPFKLSKIIKMAIGVGAMWAINPAIAAIGAVVAIAVNKKTQAREKDRLISEIKEERMIVEEKIKDADANGDKNKKYQLMRLKNSLDRAEKRITYS